MTFDKISFNFSGHENLIGNHKNTFEFTKEKELTKRGNCIIGINADFDYKKVKNFCKKFEKAKMIIYSNKNKDLKEEVSFFINKDFDDEKEIVIRKSDFISKRTFGIFAEKSAFELNRDLIQSIKNNGGYCQIIPLI
ncbi:MAG: DUF371 domain-containing protein [Candidatus Woesearchaeota archaeon]